MALDIIARAVGAAARADAASALARATPITTFTALPSTTVHPTVSFVATSGFSTAGVGAGTYVADSAATAVLASAHPRFCKASADGRYFRLMPDDRGLIPVACGGAVGFASEPMSTDALADELAILSAAEEYRHAIGAAGVRLDARRYAIRRKTLPAGTSYYDFATYVPITVRSSSKWVSTHPEGTTLYRRKANGQQCDAADFEVTTVYGANFRGGFFYILGETGTDPGPDAHSFTLDGVRLDGGLRLSMGTTFEILDKPIWQQNDRYVGHLTLAGRSGAIGFASELVYTAAADPISSTKRILTIGPEVVLGETSGSCINTNGITMKVERCLCYNAYIGIEGWTGEAGGYLKAHFRDITHACSIQGGTYTTGGFYYTPNAPTAGKLPIGQLDVVLERCVGFSIGSWITGRIVAIDSTPTIGDVATFGASGAEMVDLDIVSIADRVNPIGGIALTGGASGAQAIRNISVKLDIKRTAYAAANGKRHAAAIYTYGSLGPNIVVNLGAQEGLAGHVTYASAGYDYVPALNGYTYVESNATGGGYFDIEANNGGTLPNRPVVALSCSAAATGVKSANLPSTGVTVGTRIYVANFTRNFVNPGLDIKINGSNFRSGIDEHIAGNYTVACFQYTGSNWRVVERL